MFEELLRQLEGALVVSIDAPTEKATKLCERLGGKRSFVLVYIVTNDLPNSCFDRWLRQLALVRLSSLNYHFFICT